MSDPEVVNILVRLVRMFDVILIQEVVDVTGKAVQALLQAINNDTGEHHASVRLSVCHTYVVEVGTDSR